MMLEFLVDIKDTKFRYKSSISNKRIYLYITYRANGIMSDCSILKSFVTARRHFIHL